MPRDDTDTTLRRAVLDAADHVDELCAVELDESDDFGDHMEDIAYAATMLAEASRALVRHLAIGTPDA